MLVRSSEGMAWEKWLRVRFKCQNRKFGIHCISNRDQGYGVIIGVQPLL